MFTFHLQSDIMTLFNIRLQVIFVDFYTKGFNYYPDYILNIYVGNDISILNQKCYKIIHIESGISHITINGSEFILSGPHILCINEKDTFEFLEYNKAAVSIVIFNPSVINLKLDYLACNHLNADNDLCLTDCQDMFFTDIFKHDVSNDSKIVQIDDLTSSITIRNIRELSKLLKFQDTPSWPCRSRGLLLELLFYLAKPFDNGDDSASKLSIPPNYSKLTVDVISYLQSSYNQKLSASLMARIFHTNRTTLLNEFKKSTGVSLSQYLTQKRLQIATALLRDTQLSVTEICERTGFSDVSYFSKAFKKEINYTPSEYRNNMTKS